LQPGNDVLPVQDGSSIDLGVEEELLAAAPRSRADFRDEALIGRPGAEESVRVRTDKIALDRPAKFS